MNTNQNTMPQATLFGHPTGLFTLFFAEMWERFSYYGMRALLVFYMIKGFMGYGDKEAYAVYGAYTALVFMTPFFGGMLADRLLGARRAVVFGGLLMAAGHLMMMAEGMYCFFTALALLICGNGFFKPNISTIVGTLYPPGSPKRDGGFTIFYVGINLGAAMSPLLCGYIGETYGWHIGFGLATIGMLIGIAVFVAPTRLTQVLIFGGALAAAIGMFIYRPDNLFSIVFNIFVGIALLISGVIALTALSRGGLPKEAGGPPDAERLNKRIGGVIPMQWAVYIGTVLVIPLFVLLVSGFAPLTEDKKGVTLISESVIEGMQEGESAVMDVLAVCLEEISRPAGLVLTIVFLVASVYLTFETVKMDKIPRNRMYVVFILTFFSMLFWAFFEQAGSSLNNFTDRNVDRVTETSQIVEADVGTTVVFRVAPETSDAELQELPLLSQEQLGYHNGNEAANAQIEQAVRGVEEAKGKRSPEKIDELVASLAKQHSLTLTALTYLRSAAADEKMPDDLNTVQWTVVEGNVGMGIGGAEVPASVFQAANPIFILIFGLVFTALWGFLATLEWEPSTPVKFALGLMQLGLAFAAFWYGAHTASDRGMVLMVWLLIGYLLQTTGELCLSPVGLSMITRLSPVHLVSTVMGMWFLATGYAQLLAAIIAQFTRVTTGDDSIIPIPSVTVDIYGGVYGKIAIAAVVSGILLLLLSPLLRYWMHEETVTKLEGEGTAKE